MNKILILLYFINFQITNFCTTQNKKDEILFIKKKLNFIENDLKLKKTEHDELQKFIEAKKQNKDLINKKVTSLKQEIIDLKKDFIREVGIVTFHEIVPGFLFQKTIFLKGNNKKTYLNLAFTCLNKSLKNKIDFKSVVQEEIKKQIYTLSLNHKILLASKKLNDKKNIPNFTEDYMFMLENFQKTNEKILFLNAIKNDALIYEIFNLMNQIENHKQEKKTIDNQLKNFNLQKQQYSKEINFLESLKKNSFISYLNTIKKFCGENWNDTIEYVGLQKDETPS